MSVSSLTVVSVTMLALLAQFHFVSITSTFLTALWTLWGQDTGLTNFNFASQLGTYMFNWTERELKGVHFILLSLDLKKDDSFGVAYYTWVTFLVSHLVLPFQDSIAKWL